MGKAALWANNGDDEDSAVEAALLWQAMFINLENADIESMNIVLQHIVKEVIQKLGTISPKHQSLKKALYGTLMAGMLHNANISVQTIFSSQMPKENIVQDLM